MIKLSEKVYCISGLCLEVGKPQCSKDVLAHVGVLCPRAEVLKYPLVPLTRQYSSKVLVRFVF